MIFKAKDEAAIEIIKKEYMEDEKTIWHIAYSGGKDSTAIVKLLYNALLDIKRPKKTVKIVYCDTGVEIPIVDQYVKNTLKNLEKEIFDNNMPIKIEIVEPKLQDRFFVKVIGRGYPTPTNKFRWCTRRLRIYPIQNIMNDNDLNTVVTGVRNGESEVRDKILDNYRIDKSYYYRQADYPNTRLFAPIVKYDLDDVWSIVRSNAYPKSINGIKLELLYKNASKNIKDVWNHNVNPLIKGRFGCWTCTVVRKDNATTNLIDNGYDNLRPLLNYRNWITILRDDEHYRCKFRRNGTKSLGPFTLEARKIMLEELLKIREMSEFKIIDDKEITYIRELWEKDISSPKYRE